VAEIGQGGGWLSIRTQAVLFLRMDAATGNERRYSTKKSGGLFCSCHKKRTNKRVKSKIHDLDFMPTCCRPSTHSVQLIERVESNEWNVNFRQNKTCRHEVEVMEFELVTQNNADQLTKDWWEEYNFDCCIDINAQKRSQHVMLHHATPEMLLLMFSITGAIVNQY